jgi:cytochrome c oxidase subunit II
MMQIVIALGAILLLVILFLIFRIQVLVDILRGSSKKQAGTSNKVNAILFMVFLIGGTALFVWYSMVASVDFLPEASSIHGVQTDNLFWTTMAVISFVFIGTHILLFYFPYRYQFKEGRKAHFFPDNNKLEIIWTVIPAIVLATLIFSGWKVWTDITGEAPEDRVELEIVGKQFNWMVRYPGADGRLGAHNYMVIDDANQLGMDFTDQDNFDDFMAREVYLPVNKPVLFRIRARDVLHSVFAPHFRMKMDAVPGMPTRFHFTPTKTTAQMREELGDPNFNYEIACTEICGRGHFAMRMLIVVVDEAEYQKWYTSQPSFLSRNPEYMASVPANLKQIAARQFPDGIPAANTVSATDSIQNPQSAAGLTGTAAPGSTERNEASF